MAPYATQLETILATPTLSTKGEASLALTLASRALVTHTTTGKVISRSFPKFFNFHEKMAYKPSGEEFAFEIQEKVDGSIISLFWYDEISPGIANRGKSVGGQWIVASKTSFESPHTESAWNMLKTRYPALLDPKTSPLDRSRTYVFELVDSRMPIKVHYPYGSDLVLLSIIARDGSEPRWDKRGELDALPFRRPRVWKVEELLGGVGALKAGERNGGLLNPKLLSKLDRQNEEGFVVTFWRTKEDAHPQRFKVKLECYLASNNTPGKLASSLAKMSIKRPPCRSNSLQLPARGPPSPASLLKVYTSHRMSIPSFDGIDAQMLAIKQALLDSIRDLDVMDDYGGGPWIMKISTIWDRIDALISIQEDEWKDIVKKLEAEGYRPKAVGRKAKTLNEFEKRLAKSDIDRTLRRPLRTWFEGKGVKEVVKTVLECMEFPKDLKTEDVILLN